VKYIWNNSYLNCGCRWEWRMIIIVNFKLEGRSLKKRKKKISWSPDFFQASSFQLLKLENLLQWSLFTFKLDISEIIDIFTSEDMENTPLESPMWFRMNFTGGVFSIII